MPLKQAFAPSLKRDIKFGRKSPIAVGPHFRLRNYLRASLPPAPATCDYSNPNAPTSAALANVDLNATLGDCVIAWLAHSLALWTGNAGVAVQLSDQQITQLYSAIGGYVPGDASTDNGCDMVTAANYICQTGYPTGQKPLGWVRVDATNAAELKQALYLFEGCGFGVALPDAYVQNMPQKSGFVWDVAGASNPDYGHAFLGCGYDAKGVKIDTWGLLGTFTYAAIAQYACASNGGEIDILLSEDMIAKGMTKAPNGVDWVSLVGDFDQIGGTVPVPKPIPVPAPAPTGPVTLAQAQAWAAQGIASGACVQARSQATTLAKTGLENNWPKS